MNGIAKCGINSLSLNAFLTTQIESKKLRFHVAKNGKSKCVRMHVGKDEELCPKLQVHGTTMPSVKEITYLGDIVSYDAKNTKNIKHRTSKGIGIITQVFFILDSCSFGHFYFEMGLLLRESMFINGVLTNADVWHNFTPGEMKEFETLDLMYLRKLFLVPVSTPKEAFYLELGVIPIDIVIACRRIMYLHSIVRRKAKAKMLHSFFTTQWIKPSKGDWCEIVRNDLKELGISECLEFIGSKSTEWFREFVKAKARVLSFNNLLAKKSTHKKLNSLTYSEFRTRNYIMSDELNTNEKRLVFKVRTRMIEFGENFKGGMAHIMCPLCNLHFDHQDLATECPSIRDKVEITGSFSNLYKDKVCLNSVKLASKIMDIRKQQV